MKGLELARCYFDQVVYPAFNSEVPELMESMAFGLVGPGSECLGLDDEISRDHDWGPRVCIWVSEDLYRQSGINLQELYNSLEYPFLGYPPPKRLNPSGRRDGILSVRRFYLEHLGRETPPEEPEDWLLLPEESLSLCTGGEIFRDCPGDISTMRKALLNYYPRDVWLKKIAGHCMAAGRHGQYDLGRALMRRDKPAADYHKSRFTWHIAALGHLARRKYRPWGKWIFRNLGEMDDGGAVVLREIRRLLNGDQPDTLKNAIEACADGILKDLVYAEVPVDRGMYLYDAGLIIGEKIEDEALRSLPYQTD